jgi:hypothetical protein
VSVGFITDTSGAKLPDGHCIELRRGLALTGG